MYVSDLPMRVVCGEGLKRDSQRALPFEQLFDNGLQQRSLPSYKSLLQLIIFTILENKFIKIVTEIISK